MRRIKSRWKKIVLIVVIGFVAIQIGGSFFFYDLAIKRGSKEFLQNNADLKVADKTMELFLDGEWRDWVAAQNFEQMTMTSRDGLELNGYYLAAEIPTNKTVILTHGYLGHAKQMGLYGQYYYENLHYNIFMPDARGHGKSEGDYYGFGWPDRLDLIDWTKVLVAKTGLNSEFVYHGLSMGAATVLMASGEKDIPEQVSAIIADSPYGSVYQLFSYQMNRMFHLPAFPLLDGTSIVTNMRAGYHLKEANAYLEVQKTDIPILYIHGKNDTFVPAEMAEELYKQTASQAEIFLVDEANHGESFALQPEAYKNQITHFLANQIGPASELTYK